MLINLREIVEKANIGDYLFWDDGKDYSILLKISDTKVYYEESDRLGHIHISRDTFTHLNTALEVSHYEMLIGATMKKQSFYEFLMSQPIGMPFLRLNQSDGEAEIIRISDGEYIKRTLPGDLSIMFDIMSSARKMDDSFTYETFDLDATQHTIGCLQDAKVCTCLDWRSGCKCGAIIPYKGGLEYELVRLTGIQK